MGGPLSRKSNFESNKLNPSPRTGTNPVACRVSMTGHVIPSLSPLIEWITASTLQFPSKDFVSFASKHLHTSRKPKEKEGGAKSTPSKN